MQCDQWTKGHLHCGGDWRGRRDGWGWGGDGGGQDGWDEGERDGEERNENGKQLTEEMRYGHASADFPRMLAHVQICRGIPKAKPFPVLFKTSDGGARPIESRL